jgi:hypothetical protein
MTDWNQIISLARKDFESGDFDERERNYKGEIAKNFRAARQALDAPGDVWIELLRRAFGPPNNITSFYVHGRFLDWCRAEPEAARLALRALWDEDLSVEARIRGFSAAFPSSVQSGTGSRLTLASVLHMAVDPENCPPFRARAFKFLYELFGVPHLGGKHGEAERYDGALHLLDRFITEAERRGLKLRDRLDAQGLTWSLFKAEPPIVIGPIRNGNDEHSLKRLAEETGIDRAVLRRWFAAIERRGQAVFYGPPGTGKTFLAERLAKHLLGEGDGFVELVQFHPAYAYEDFIQGIRPKTAGESLTYEIVPGRFLDFCARAEGCSDTCVLIIDEINRANLSRVFGELMYLLEYRDKSVPLAGGETLSVPPNVRIIGTMNTADRSIALVDHALRRRFAFIELRPDYELMKRYLRERGFDATGLAEVLQDVNRQIGDPHYELGISFFLRDDLATHLEDIWTMEIEPYLVEYFFGQPDKVNAFRWKEVAKRALPGGG